jgi:hypothetical protein
MDRILAGAPVMPHRRIPVIDAPAAPNHRRVLGPAAGYRV